MLTIENISVNYGAIEALTGISMHVEKGEVVTLIGANGAGKTTTLRTITGLLEPREGRILFEGEEISGKPTHQLVARGISMSPEGRGVFANLSVRENLQMGAYLKKNKTEIAEDMERAFQMFPRLKERESQKAGTLSGGEQQMLAMSRALMSRPRLLLLDEPSLGLAPLVAKALVDTGSTWLVVPQHVANQLRLNVLEEREITLADGAKKLVPYAGPVRLRFQNRNAFTGALVMGEEVLLGAIPMEDMDLVVHPLSRKLIANPSNPNIPGAMAVGVLPSRKDETNA